MQLNSLFHVFNLATLSTLISPSCPGGLYAARMDRRVLSARPGPPRPTAMGAVAPRQSVKARTGQCRAPFVQKLRNFIFSLFLFGIPRHRQRETRSGAVEHDARMRCALPRTTTAQHNMPFAI